MTPADLEAIEAKLETATRGPVWPPRADVVQLITEVRRLSAELEALEQERRRLAIKVEDLEESRYRLWKELDRWKN